VLPDGQVQHIKGARGEENLVRVVLPDGHVQHFKGARGEEHVVRVVLPDGHVQHYEGPKSKEHVVRIVLPDGTVEHWGGAKGEESMWCVAYPNGKVEYWEGPHGEERRVHDTRPYSVVAKAKQEAERIERERVERVEAAKRAVAKEKREAERIERVRKLTQEEEADRRAVGIQILVRNTVARAINSMPVMREARVHDVQMAERTREARECAHDELEGDRALAAAVAEEVARMRQDYADKEAARIAQARANNAEVGRKAVGRERVLKERRDWARAEKAREKADRLVEQQKAAEAAAVAAAMEADRIKKAAWTAQREAAKAAHRANNAPKLSSKNLGKLPQGRAFSSTDDDSSSVAASQAVSMAPSIRKSYTVSQDTLPRMTGHASVQKHREGKPRGLTEAQWQLRKRDCLTAPDRKWVQYDALTGDPTTVVQKADLKLYLSRDGAVIKTVVWQPRKAQRDSDEDSATSDAGGSSSSASSVQAPVELLPSHDFAKVVEERHIAEAIRRSLADMVVHAV